MVSLKYRLKKSEEARPLKINWEAPEQCGEDTHGPHDHHLILNPQACPVLGTEKGRRLAEAGRSSFAAAFWSPLATAYKNLFYR